MYEVLKNVLDENILQGAFIQPNNEQSSSTYYDKQAVSVLKINTSKKIKKENDKLSIDDLIYDISKLNILDVFYLLSDNLIDTSFINNSNSWNYPALMLRDFCNVEFNEINPTLNPYPSVRFNTKSTGILPVSQENIEIIKAYSSDKNYSFEFKNDYLYIKDVDNLLNIKVIYKITYNSFYVKLYPNTVITNNEEFLSKHLDGLK